MYYTLIASDAVQVASQRIHTSWAWYIIRAAGFSSAGLLILIMLSGIGLVTGLTYKILEPIKAWAVHKALALALCVAIAVHVGFLLIDHFVKFSLSQLFVPFLSKYNNNTKLLGIPLGWAAVAMGILAMYGVAIVVISSLGWIDTKKRAWRLLHYLSYLVMFFVFLHALYLGTDLRYGTFRMVWILIGGVMGLAVILRLARSGSMKHKDSTPKDD